jgi:hypothetical protein
MKKLCKMLIAGTIATTTILSAGFSQASAATSTTACFKWGSNAPAPGAPYMNRNVQLWQTNSVGTPIVKLRDGRTGSNGCATFFNTPSNINLRMRAVHVDYIWGGTDVYEGWSQRHATPGQGGQLLGVGYVYYIG